MEPVRFATVHKNGSSWAVVIPKEVCRAFGIERGDQLAVTTPADGVVAFRKILHHKRQRTIKY